MSVELFLALRYNSSWLYSHMEVMSLSSSSYVAIVGGMNVDISGTSDSKIILGDSNPGKVTLSLGGVGRNIAENLILLGKSCRMVTVLGDDLHAETIRADCRRIGLDLSACETIPGAKSSTYLCINDINSDLMAAVADMSICEMITPHFLKKHLDVLNGAEFVIVDANIPPASAAFLADWCESPLIADTVSIKKASRLSPCLWRLLAIKPNRPEAELLTGVPIRGTQGLDDAASELLNAGVRNVFISLGSLGVYYADQTHHGIQSCIPGSLVNTNGCGDSFLAAASLSLMSGMSIAEAALLGQASASICAEAESAVNPALNMRVLRKRAGLDSNLSS